MDDSESKGTGPQTQPPSVGVERLGALVHEFQTLAQSLSVEWAQADETRIALAQVLAERQAQFEEIKERAEQLEARLPALEQTQAETGAERERLQAEITSAVARAEDLARSMDTERARAQEERAALEAQAAQERSRVEELQARLEAVEKDAHAQASTRTAELESRIGTLEQELGNERTRNAEAQAQSEIQATAQRAQLEELQSRLAAAEKDAQSQAGAGTGELETRVATLEQELVAERTRSAEAQAHRETEATEERTRLEELQARLDAAEKAARAAAAGPAVELEAQLAALAKERNELKAARDLVRPEVDELKLQVEGLMRQADGERARWQEERSGIAAERYKALSEAAQLRARVEELEADSARTQPQVSAAAEVTEQTRAQLKAAEERLGSLGDEVATLKAERSLLLEKQDAAEHARASADQLRMAAEAERDRAKAETSPLWGTIESLQRQIAQERERFEAQLAQGPAGAPRAEVEAVERRLATETQAAAAAVQRAEQAETELSALRARSDALLGTLKTSLQALHRTPFVSPTVRVAFSGLDDEVGPAATRKGPRGPRLLFLDRDPLSVEPLANDLEQHGADVLVAHYSDEVSFFLKTSEAKNLSAVVADVMCFRSDQDMVERYKAWRQDAPAATLVVSYRADNPIEAERARTVPGNLGAIHVARTVGREALLEALSKRSAGKSEPAAGLFRRFKR